MVAKYLGWMWIYKSKKVKSIVRDILGNDPFNDFYIMCMFDNICRYKWGRKWYSGVCIQHQNMWIKLGEQISKYHNKI